MNTNLIVDILLVISTLLFFWFGWSTGLIRAFFAVLAGFVAIFSTYQYPYHEGVNAYFIFSIAAVIVVIIGVFTLRLINFFCLNFLDRIVGACFSACVWLVVAVNVIVPTMSEKTKFTARDGYIYPIVSNVMQTKTALFKDYIPTFLSGNKR